jgi:hypothetical protein
MFKVRNEENLLGSGASKNHLKWKELLVHYLVKKSWKKYYHPYLEEVKAEPS